MNLSIIIVSFNMREYLKRCLSSIYANTKDIAFEIIVIDNASSDDSQEMVKQIFSQVRLVCNERNLGFAKACNQGIRLSLAKFILLLNPDTEVLSGSLKKMIDFAEAKKDVGILGPKLISLDGYLQPSCRQFPNIFTDFMESTFLNRLFPNNNFFNWLDMGNWRHDSIREVDQPMGACLLIKRDIFDEIGYLDERFFLFYEEVDFCYRVKKKGKKIFFYPDSEIIHRTKVDIEPINEQIIGWRIRSKRLFFIKHYTYFSLIFLITNLIIFSVLVFLIFSFFVFFTRRSIDVSYFQKIAIISWREYLKNNKSLS